MPRRHDVTPYITELLCCDVIDFTLIETAKMKRIYPEASLAWVLERIQDHPQNRIAKLPPWAYKDMIDAAESDAETATSFD